MSNPSGLIKAIVDRADHELILDTEEWGTIYMGTVDHSLVDRQIVWIDVVDRFPNTHHQHDYLVGQAFKEHDDPKIVYVHCKEFRYESDDREGKAT